MPLDGHQVRRVRPANGLFRPNKHKGNSASAQEYEALGSLPDHEDNYLIRKHEYRPDGS